MATKPRKAAIGLENIAALGVDRLAQLVLDGANRDPAFKRLVSAALAGAKGPKAVISLIERRISGLERARGFIDWDKAKSFVVDLEITVKTIVDELGPKDPSAAVELLMRFLLTYNAATNRMADRIGEAENVYADAIEALGPLSLAMPSADRAKLTERILVIYERAPLNLPMIIAKLAPAMPEKALAALDAKLSQEQKLLENTKSKSGEFETPVGRNGLIESRQALALARGDHDAYIALEKDKDPHFQNHITIAETLLSLGRAQEALSWVREAVKSSMFHTTYADMADGLALRDPRAERRTLLEADILEALGRGVEAQELRWAAFEETLEPEPLRVYIAHLDDFAEFDALDRAFAYAAASKSFYRALMFFMAWPQLDRAAQLIIEQRALWNGRYYHILAPAAETLEETHPIAAIVLYRVLLDDILNKSKSDAYGHGATYLARLDQLAEVDVCAAAADIEPHEAYRAGVQKKHSRKYGFWARVKEKAGKVK